jgi:hypothetical protein
MKSREDILRGVPPMCHAILPEIRDRDLVSSKLDD